MKKKLLLLWSLLLCFVTANAVEFDLTTGYTNQQDVTTVEKDGVTLTFDKGAGSNAPKWYTSGTAVRLYAKGTLTVSATSNITSITLTIGSGTNALTVDGGTYDADTKTWTGSAESVKFTEGGTSGNLQIKKVSVTLGAAPAVAKPSITGAELFTGSTNITIATTTEDATIYYTTDGTAPSAASTKYTAPFAITATTTVKAIAIKGTDESSLATATFTAVDGVADIAAMNALANNTQFGFTGSAVVTYSNKSKGYHYIKDATGESLIYSYDYEFAKGDKLKAGWIATVSIYKDLFEVKPNTTIEKDGTAAVTIPEAALTDVTTANANKVVELKGVTYTAPDADNKFTITDGTNTINGYNKFALDIPAPITGKTYNITGAISRTNDDVEFFPIEGEVANPEVVAAEISPATGAELSAAVKAKKDEIEAAGDKLGKLTINLAKDGAYTLNAGIEATAGIIIKGDAEGAATIDATNVGNAFINFGANPNVSKAKKADESDSNYFLIDEVEVSNVKITGLSKPIINNAAGNVDFAKVTFDNDVIELIGSSSAFAMGNGFAGDLKITNSTLWSKDGHTGFLFQAQGRPKDIIDGTTTTSWTIDHSTLYQIAKGKKANNNNSGIKGQSTTTMTLTNSILIDFGSSTGNEVNGWMWGQNSGANAVYRKNTYWSAATEGAVVTGWTDSGKGLSDQTDTSLTSDPKVKDAANGDFTIGASTDQAKEKTGDPRWLVEYIPTGISTITVATDADDNAPMYNLAGQKVGKDYKGIVIKNGKKVVIK